VTYVGLPVGALDIFVTHGELAWVALLIASVSFGVLVPGLRGRRRARRRATVERDALGAPVDAPDLGGGEVVVVEGRLVVEDGPTPRVEDGGDAAAVSLARRPGSSGPARGDRRAERLVLVTPSGRVVLDGPIEVRVGSRELRPLRRFHQLSDAVRRWAKELGEVDDDAELIVRSVRDGDRVRARGVARRSAPGAEGTYREAELVWTLSAAPTRDGPGRVVVVALDPPTVRAPGVRARVWAAVAAAHVFVGVAWVVGAVAMSLAAGGSAPALRVAACTPFHRGAALDEVERALESEGRALSAERIAVRALRHGSTGCGLTTWPSERPMSYAARITEACGSYVEHDRLALLYLNSGRLEDASASASRARSLRSADRDDYMYWSSHLPLHLLAGDLEAAAEAARLGADYEAARDRAEGYHEEREARLRCVEAVVEAQRGGDPSAALAALRTRSEVPACAVLRAELLEGAARVAALDGCSECTGERTTRRVDWLWRFGAECVDSVDIDCRRLLARAPHWRAVERLTEGRPTYSGALPTLERELLARIDARDAPPTTARVAHALSTLALAEHYSAAGDFERAARLAARAEREWGALADADPAFWLGSARDREDAHVFGGPSSEPPSVAEVIAAARRLRVIVAVHRGQLARALELAGPDDPLRPLLELSRGPRRTTLDVADRLEDLRLPYVAELLRMRVVFATDLSERVAELVIVGAILDREGRERFLAGLRIDPTFPSQDARYNVNRRVRERVVLRAFGAPERAADAEIEVLREAFEQPERALLLHLVYD